MVKYNSKGSLPQNADYYALLNRSDADWRDSVRQGLCAKGDGVSGRINYSTALSQGIVPEAGLNDLDLRFNVCADFYELAGGTLPGHFIRCSTGQFSPFSFFCIAGRKDTIGMSVRNSANSADISTPMTFDRNILKNDIIKITFTAGNPNSSLRFWLNGVEQALSPLAVAGVDKIYNHNFATAQMGFFARPDGSRPYAATICNVQIRTGGVLKFFAPLDGTTYDVVTGGAGTITGTVSLAERCDNSTFRNDEHPFAIGTTLVGNASGCLNYGVRNLITTSTTKMRWQFQLNTVAGAGTTRQICSEYNSTGNKRGWHWYISSENVLTIRVGDNGGAGNAYAQAITGCTPESGDYFDITFNAGVFTVVKNGTTTYTQDKSATQIAIYNNNSPSLNVGGYVDSAASSYNGSLCCFKIWVDNISDDDTPKFECDYRGITTDKISGTLPSVVGSMVYVPQIHPRLLDDSGYAGTIVAPYTEFAVKPYPNTFTGNWHELTHAYFDKSNTDIWEDFIRESINYISEEPTYWNVDEISQDYFDKYVKAAYRDKIYCGLGAEDDDYRGAVMVFESGVPAALLSELTFWRKRKGFPVDRRVAWVDIDTPITLTAGASGTITGRGYFVGQHIEVEVRLSGETPEDAWTPFGTATVAGDGSWTVSGTIASADTYDFRVIDENIDPAECFAQVDDVAVASGEVIIDDFESYTVGSNIGAPWFGMAVVWKCNNSYSSKAGEYGANDRQNDLVARDFPDQPLNLTGKKISMKVRKDAGVTVLNHRFYVRNNLGQNVAQLEVNSPTGYSDSAWTTLEWTLTAISGQNLNTCKSIALSWRTTSYAGRIYIDDLKII